MSAVLAPEIASEITLQPIRRFDFDAAIIFSDILVVPYALGQSVSFDGGVMMGELPNLENIFEEAFLKNLEPVFKAIEMARANLPRDRVLIGFAGCPFTVLCYMLGGQKQDGFLKAKTWAFCNQLVFEDLLDKLVDLSVLYLKEQIKAGADAIQLFESWASLVPYQFFDSWLLRPVQKIIASVKKDFSDVPITVYAKGLGNCFEFYWEKLGADCFSIDAGVNPEDFPKGQVLQGNMDPMVLLADEGAIERSVMSIKEKFEGRPFVFNLGHGILPQTPVASVENLVKFVRQV